MLRYGLCWTETCEMTEPATHILDYKGVANYYLFYSNGSIYSHGKWYLYDLQLRITVAVNDFKTHQWLAELLITIREE